LKASINVVLALSLSLSACTAAFTITTPESDCYRPHWTIPSDFKKDRQVKQGSFTMHTGAPRFLTLFSPGPFEHSVLFVMSPDPSDESVTASTHRGVLLDSNRDGHLDCFILGGGTLQDRKGRPVPYNFFAVDLDGDGRIEKFIGEDLDLDGDRVMDRSSQAILMDPDPNGHFRKGVYVTGDSVRPIRKEGSVFLLNKPLWIEPFRFQDDEVTKMTLFTALQKLWDELQRH
jgi:hypothetical protein